MKYFMVLSCLILTGCTTTSEIIPFGKNQYTVTAESETGIISAKKAAIKKASEFCRKKGLKMEPMAANQGSESAGIIHTGNGIYSSAGTWSNYDLTFKCYE